MRSLICIIMLSLLFGYSCTGYKEKKNSEFSLVYDYPFILDICYTPDHQSYCTGWFTDKGSWLGFTLPEKQKWINGFCGPFNLESRRWISSSLLTVGFDEGGEEIFLPDSINYFPGELFLKATSQTGTIEQRLFFIDKSTLLLTCESSVNQPFVISGYLHLPDTQYEFTENTCTILLTTGEQINIHFSDKVQFIPYEGGYKAITQESNQLAVVLSYLYNSKENGINQQSVRTILNDPSKHINSHHIVWDNYIQKVLRSDMNEAYDRIAVKSLVTLLSNWRSSRGGLLHEGVVPSHAAHYFMGFWAWDSWKHAVALSVFAPELAKNQVRAMFDYQLEDGMVIDCIYPNIHENNARDSKPPLAAWAVYEIFKNTGDTAFVKEMFPQLVNYYRWWYRKRDHNANGFCEFGSVDGTHEAAAWESGMDNAIRFDDAQMVKNAEDAWSFNQESVDLNAFLALEHQLLTKLSVVADQSFIAPEHTQDIIDYFFDEEVGYFFDRGLNGEFIKEEGSEGYIPFWSRIATPQQMERAIELFKDTAKFSTYIPFPTVAADNEKFMPKGYWRGPIWLDQTYFGISGLRKYGYTQLADEYTRQVFDRLQGLKESAPIHENYGTHTGEPLKAPHFSWSSAHLLMLYWEYGKDLTE